MTVQTVWVISPAGIPVPTQVPYEYRIFHTKLVNKGLEVVIREELNADQWKRYEIFQDTLGGRPYLFNGGLPPGGSDGSGTPGIDYQVPAEALTDSEFAAIYKEAQKYVGTPYVLSLIHICNSPSYGTTFQKMGHELLSRDELAVLDGGKCILQLRGVRPFLSDKYDLTQHPSYKLTSDYDPKNTFDIEKYLNRKEKIYPGDEFIVVDADSLPSA